MVVYLGYKSAFLRLLFFDGAKRTASKLIAPPVHPPPVSWLITGCSVGPTTVVHAFFAFIR
jgi:hypothetical protein